MFLYWTLKIICLKVTSIVADVVSKLDGNKISEFKVNSNKVKKDMEGDIKFKPGKLNGKKLAAIAKELAEADLYYLTFGGKKPKPEESKIIKSLVFKFTPVENITKSERRIPLKRFTSRPFVPTATRSPVSRLSTPTAQQLADAITPEKNKNLTRIAPARRLTSRLITSRPLRSRPLTSAPRTTLPWTTTTTTPRPTTPGVCGSFCSLAGTIVIDAGLEWAEELLHSFPKMYKETTAEIVSEISEVFSKADFGSALEFVSIEDLNEDDDRIFVNFYMQFSGSIINNIATDGLKRSFVNNLEADNDTLMLGRFLIDIDASNFHVADTSVPVDKFISEAPDTVLPDWAWLVIVGGLISTLIIVFFGVVMGVQKYRQNQVVKRRVLNPRTLNAFKGQMHFDTVAVDHAKAYASDKRDMWTLQKAQQAMGGRSKAASSRDSYGGGNVSHNDSKAELLGANDTTLDERGEILDTNALKKDVSDDRGDDFEEELGDKSVFSRNSNLRVSRGDMLDSLDDRW